jgi:HTH-type transcriptional regulator/antitoxin HigA
MAIHPGTILKEELRERKIKQRELAEQMGMQPSHLSEIVRGKRPMTKTVADKLEAVLGIPSIDWMRLQLAYDYKILDQESGFTERLNRLRKGAAIL